MKRGLLLFAHGARDSRWALPFEDIAERVHILAAELPPGLVEAGHRLVAAGCERVDVVPLFLGAGGHVRQDIPSLLAELEHDHPAVHWELRPAIGEVDSVVQAMASAALAWVERE